MVGIDIVKINRFEESFQNWIDKVLSPSEKTQIEPLSHKCALEYLAGRFSAKEAYIKASGEKARPFKSISIIDDENGKPHIYIDEREVGEVSIAHDEYAIAIVIIKEM